MIPFEEFKQQYSKKLNLNNHKWKFVTNAYSMKDRTLKIYIEEIENNEILYFQLYNFKTKHPLSMDIYMIDTNNIKYGLEPEVFIGIDNDIVIKVIDTTKKDTITAISEGIKDKDLIAKPKERIELTRFELINIIDSIKMKELLDLQSYINSKLNFLEDDK